MIKLHHFFTKRSSTCHLVPFLTNWNCYFAKDTKWNQTDFLKVKAFTAPRSSHWCPWYCLLLEYSLLKFVRLAGDAGWCCFLLRYRARVERVMGNTISVIYIDFGNVCRRCFYSIRHRLWCRWFLLVLLASLSMSWLTIPLNMDASGWIISWLMLHICQTPLQRLQVSLLPRLVFKTLVLSVDIFTLVRHWGPFKWQSSAYRQLLSYVAVNLTHIYVLGMHREVIWCNKFVDATDARQIKSSTVESVDWWRHPAKRWVFSWLRNNWSEGADVTSCGRLFHVCEQTTGIDCPPANNRTVNRVYMISRCAKNSKIRSYGHWLICNMW